MYAIGLLSIIQMSFLPGFLLLHRMKMADGVLKTICLSLALSVLLNHFIAVILVMLGLFVPRAAYLVIVVELVLFFLAVRSVARERIATLVAPDIDCARALIAIRPDTGLSGRIASGFVIGLALATIGYFGLKALTGFGDVFVGWDAVASWNRWAVQWSQQKLPTGASWYPQALPTTWAWSYVLLGDSTPQFFAKAIMPLFGLYMLLALLDLGLRKKCVGLVSAVPVTGVLLCILFGVQRLADGHADIPIAFMSLMPIYVLLLPGRLGYPRIALGAVLCAGAALTKQAGLFLFAAYPIAVWVVLRLRTPDGTRRSRVAAALSSATLIALLVLPWYGFASYCIARGMDRSNLDRLTVELHEGRDWAARLIRSGQILDYQIACAARRAVESSYSLRKVVAVTIWIVLLGGVCLALYDPYGRLFVFVIIVPFYLLWALFFSYDQRNVALIVPFVGLAVGIGSRHWAHVYRWVRCIGRMRVYGLLLLLLAVILAGHLAWDTEEMLRRQDRQHRSMDNSSLNAVLYDALASSSSDDKIVSDYLMLRYMPGLEDRLTACSMRRSGEFLQRTSRSDTRYVLVRHHTASDDVMTLVFDGLHSQRFRLIAETNDVLPYGWTLVEVLSP